MPPGLLPQLFVRLVLSPFDASDRAAEIWSLVEEGAEILLPFQPDLVLRTSEPRTYRVASGAWQQARRVLEGGQLKSLHLTSESGMPAPLGYGAELSLRLGFENAADVPVVVTLDASAALNAPVSGIDAARVVDTMKRWATTHDSSQGFTSARSPDSLARLPDFEVGMRQVRSWTATRRFLQAVGWGTFLGPDLCARLGGPREVATRTPAFRAELVGRGAFLQVAPSPDDEVSPEDWAPLLEYLRPLLPTEQDRIPPTRVAHGAVRPLTLETITSPAGFDTKHWKPGFEINVVEDNRTDGSVELSFRSRPSANVRNSVVLVLEAWCRHDLAPTSEPAASSEPAALDTIGRSIRWTFTSRVLDSRGSVSKLADRLEAFSRLMMAPLERLAVTLPSRSTPTQTPGRARRRSRPRPKFPVVVVDQSGVDAIFNLYFESPLLPDQCEQLRATLRTWYDYGLNGGYGGSRFHDMREPVFDGASARWYVDLGLADAKRAVHGLARRLQEFSHLNSATIERLVIGEEFVE